MKVDTVLPTELGGAVVSKLWTRIWWDLGSNPVILISVFRGFPKSLQWLERSPSTTEIRARYLAGSLPDFRMWKSCWTKPLAGFIFSGYSRFPRHCVPAPLYRSHFMSCPGMTGAYGSQLESPSLGEAKTADEAAPVLVTVTCNDFTGMLVPMLWKHFLLGVATATHGAGRHVSRQRGTYGHALEMVAFIRVKCDMNFDGAAIVCEDEDRNVSGEICRAAVILEKGKEKGFNPVYMSDSMFDKRSGDVIATAGMQGSSLTSSVIYFPNLPKKFASATSLRETKRLHQHSSESPSRLASVALLGPAGVAPGHTLWPRSPR
ncbi:hypothetical protein PR048_003302 [Dryococelus australis]|uniref:Uncharacterized protein n=1 Tax=Dryococelus australis TaxID=614101 RepID=A0ABQ9IMR2_9NEOP|nr:hypothetical protein PR048_003302 [Dryococelus australis]